jgi:hypothetical protein
MKDLIVAPEKINGVDYCDLVNNPNDAYGDTCAGKVLTGKKYY